jgi:hypothetical protein
MQNSFREVNKLIIFISGLLIEYPSSFPFIDIAEERCIYLTAIFFITLIIYRDVLWSVYSFITSYRPPTVAFTGITMIRYHL